MSNLNHVELLLTAEEHTISRKDLATDPKMQMRVQMDQETIEQYAGNIEAILEEHPIEVVAVDVNGYVTWYVVDGFHRYHAAVMAEVENVKIKMMSGTYDQALQYAMSANWKNGLRPKKDDAARSIEMLLETAPDFGMDSKQVIPWLETFGIPKTTARDNTKNLRADIDNRRDSEIIKLNDEGISQVQIAKAVGAARDTVQRIIVSEEAACRNERAAQIGTPDASLTSILPEDFDCPFDITEEDLAPAINPADAFQKALNEHEEERQETTRLQDNSASSVKVTSTGNKSLIERLKDLHRSSGIFEDHTKAEINAALFSISQGN